MDKLPNYIETWVVKRTQERHYLCRLCAGPNDDHGPEETFQNHLSSWDHKIRIRKMNALFCKACDIQFRYPSHFRAHTISKSHIWNINPETKPTNVFACTCCNASFVSKKDELKHLATRKHAKNMAKHENGSVSDRKDGLPPAIVTVYSQDEFHSKVSSHPTVLGNSEAKDNRGSNVPVFIVNAKGKSIDKHPIGQ